MVYADVKKKIMMSRMIKIRNFVLLAFVGLCTNSLIAQNYILSVNSDKDTIIIGEHNNISIEAKLPKNVELIFPEYKDTLASKVEVLLDGEVQIEEDENYKIYRKKILVTSFDTGLNIIPFIPVRVVENSDTNNYITDTLSFFVKPYVLLDTIPVDTIYANRSGFIVFGKDDF